MAERSHGLAREGEGHSDAERHCGPETNLRQALDQAACVLRQPDLLGVWDTSPRLRGAGWWEDEIERAVQRSEAALSERPETRLTQVDVAAELFRQLDLVVSPIERELRRRRAMETQP